MPVQTIIKHRRSTAATWTSTNPTLAAGEIGLETDTGLVKYGDGSTAWTSLAYPSTTAIRQYVKNSSGSAMTKGQAVYISGSNGSNALISLSQANAESTSSKTLGLLVQDLANNGLGYVITDGYLGGLNTGTASAGDAVWLSPSTAGGLVYGLANKPVAPNHMVYIGIVTRASSTVGEILVKVQNGFELDELHDVLITSKANNDILQYESSTGLWKNKAAPTLTNAYLIDPAIRLSTTTNTSAGRLAYSGATLKLGNNGTLVTFSDDSVNATTYAAASHTHTFANITDVNITSPTNGQSLTYDSASSKWINSAAAATGETISSFLWWRCWLRQLVWRQRRFWHCYHSLRIR